MHFSIDGRTIPVLSRQSANVENSFAPQPYTNTTNLSDRSGRQMGYQANSCDSVENKTSSTSYSDVAKKLVMSSTKTNDGDNLDKLNANDNDTMKKHEESFGELIAIIYIASLLDDMPIASWNIENS